MKNNLSLLLLFLILVTFSSCFDIQSETVISEEGKIDMVYDFDMSDMMSMLQMALAMDEENENVTEAKDPIEAMFKRGVQYGMDTTFTLYDMMAMDKPLEAPSELLKENNEIMLKIDPEASTMRFKIHTFFDNQEEMVAFSAIQNEEILRFGDSKEDGALPETFSPSSMAMGFDELEYSIEDGYYRVRMEVPELDSLADGEDKEFEAMFAEMMDVKTRITFPGKVRSVTFFREDGSYELLDDYTVLLTSQSSAESIFAFANVEILFDPQSIYSKPEATEVWDPIPVKVNIGTNNVPSDAQSLITDKLSSLWQKEDGGKPSWKINEDGSMTVVPNSGSIMTKETYEDVQLHVEWRTDPDTKGEGQNRGNSGVFLQSKYEVQVLDNYENRTYSNGQAGSLYKQSIPLVNAGKPTGEWQAYDIIYRAPVFNDKGDKIESATITVLHNGVLIQDNVALKGSTEYIGKPLNVPHGPLPLMLQDHGEPVSYRNIWIRRI